MKSVYLYLFMALLGLGLQGCGKGNNSSSSPENTITENTIEEVLGRFGGSCATNKKMVGYFPSWQGEVSDIQYNKLTHINYSFLMPNNDGSLKPIDNKAKLHALVTAAANFGVKVGIATGGWNGGDDSAFVSLAASAGTRTAFVNNVINFINTHSLDGLDMDWEYPEVGAESDNFSLLMNELSIALHAQNKYLTAAVVATGDKGAGIQDSVFNDVDFLNLMAYDETENDHSSYSYAVKSVNYWRGRGLSREKTVLGVPLYARPKWNAYKSIITESESNACRDRVGGNNYNGIPTIRRKAEISNSEVCGIMFWELSQDTINATSLLTTVYEVITGASRSYNCS